jgi:hypothetical protein
MGWFLWRNLKWERNTLVLVDPNSHSTEFLSLTITGD